MSIHFTLIIEFLTLVISDMGAGHVGFVVKTLMDSTGVIFAQNVLVMLFIQDVQRGTTYGTR